MLGELCERLDETVGVGLAQGKAPGEGNGLADESEVETGGAATEEVELERLLELLGCRRAHKVRHKAEVQPEVVLGNIAQVDFFAIHSECVGLRFIRGGECLPEGL